MGQNGLRQGGPLNGWVTKDLKLGDSFHFASGKESILIENNLGQCSVIIMEKGEKKKEMILGLKTNSHLILEPVFPDRPFLLELHPEILISPGGWVKGYLPIPVGLKIWISPGDSGSKLIGSIGPGDLKLSFIGKGKENYVHPIKARLSPKRIVPRNPMNVAVLPVHMCSKEKDWIRIGKVFLSLKKAGINRLGGYFYSDPVRIVFAGNKAILNVKNLKKEGSRPDGQD